MTGWYKRTVSGITIPQSKINFNFFPMIKNFMPISKVYFQKAGFKIAVYIHTKNQYPQNT